MGKAKRAAMYPSSAAVIACVALCACGEAAPDPKTVSTESIGTGGTGVKETSAKGQKPPEPADPLAKPELGPPKAFTPSAPEVLKAAAGTTVWLAERHSLPLVAVTITIPKGSAADPTDKPGLAHITADMLDEGAGTRGAVEI